MFNLKIKEAVQHLLCPSPLRQLTQFSILKTKDIRVIGLKAPKTILRKTCFVLILYYLGY